MAATHATATCDGAVRRRRRPSGGGGAGGVIAGHRAVAQPKGGGIKARAAACAQVYSQGQRSGRVAQGRQREGGGARRRLGSRARDCEQVMRGNSWVWDVSKCCSGL